LASIEHELPAGAFLPAAAGEADDASMPEPPNQVGCRNVFDDRERSAVRGGVQRWTIGNGCLARGEAR